MTDWEIALVRWLEREGFDVSYQTDVELTGDPAGLNVTAWYSPSVMTSTGRRRCATGSRSARCRDEPRLPGCECRVLAGPVRGRRTHDHQLQVAVRPRAAVELKTALFREVGRPECALLGVQHRGAPELGRHDYFVTAAGASDPWAAGTGFFEVANRECRQRRARHVPAIGCGTLRCFSATTPAATRSATPRPCATQRGPGSASSAQARWSLAGLSTRGPRPRRDHAYRPRLQVHDERHGRPDTAGACTPRRGDSARRRCTRVDRGVPGRARALGRVQTAEPHGSAARRPRVAAGLRQCEDGVHRCNSASGDVPLRGCCRRRLVAVVRDADEPRRGERGTRRRRGAELNVVARGPTSAKASSDLYAVDLRRMKARRLTGSQFAELQPAWSADGSRLALTVSNELDGVPPFPPEAARFSSWMRTAGIGGASPQDRAQPGLRTDVQSRSSAAAPSMSSTSLPVASGDSRAVARRRGRHAAGSRSR